MRRFFLTGFLCGMCGVAFGAPWNVLDNEAQTHYKPSKSLSKLAADTLLPQLLARREPLRYCVEGAPFVKQYAHLLERGYTEWASATARIIRQANRADEFADLLPFLEKPLLFERQFCSYNAKIEDAFHPSMEETYWETNFVPQSEQVRLIILPKDQVARVCFHAEYGEAVACAGSPEFGAHVIVMARAEETESSEWWLSLLHEVGHTLGMGEGYALGAVKNSPFFGTKPRAASVMKGQGEPQECSCDDADAVIVLSDALSIPGKPARRGDTARTFQSLCTDDPIWYVEGRQQNKPPRAAGDARGFSQTSYHADGKVNRFSMFAPFPKGFSGAFRLFDTELSAGRASAADGMTYYPASDGRTFAVEELEDPSFRRLFTLRDKHLLGQTFLDFSTPGTLRASTTLHLQNKNTRLARVETLHRRTDNSRYGTYFVYAVFEGRVREGVLEKTSARMAYVFKDWMVVNLIEPGETKITTFLLEKGKGGQQMQVYQGDWEKELAGGSFALTLTDVTPLGELSERDKKYLQTFASAADEGMRAELLSAGESSVTQLGKSSDGNISAKKVSAWAAQALDLHSKMGRALQYQFDGGLLPARGCSKTFPEFQTLFRPMPHVPSAKSKTVR